MAITGSRWMSTTQAVSSTKRAAQSKVVRMMVLGVGQTEVETDPQIVHEEINGTLAGPTFTCHFRPILSACFLECTAARKGLEPPASSQQQKAEVKPSFISEGFFMARILCSPNTQPKHS